MLEIKPCLEPGQVAAYCKKCGRLFGPAYYLYLAKDGDKLSAAALFEVRSDHVAAIWYDGDEADVWLFDAVLRAGLNYAADHGIPTGCLPEAFREAHAGFFGRLNYPTGAMFDITNFFSKYKNCGML